MRRMTEMRDITIDGVQYVAKSALDQALAEGERPRRALAEIRSTVLRECPPEPWITEQLTRKP